MSANPSSTFCQLHNIVALMTILRGHLLLVDKCLKRDVTLIFGSRACLHKKWMHTPRLYTLQLGLQLQVLLGT